MNVRMLICTVAVLCSFAVALGAERPAKPVFRAGAAAVDITPTKLPVIVSGYTFERTVDVVQDPLYARCLVFDDGIVQVAIVVVDTCLMPRDLIDRAKELARKQTGISADRMLVSATHTHSAASAMGALGSRADPEYVEFLPGRIAEAIRRAHENLAPARIGWTVTKASEHTHCRRWIMRPDRVGIDPFSRKFDRVKMCPRYQDLNAVGPAGPVDSDLSLLSVQTTAGRPVALLANYSMHYFHATPISAGYYGRFVRRITKLLGAEDQDPAFIAIMSQGTSGDQMYMDFSKPNPNLDINTYASAVAQIAYEACNRIEYRDWVPLAMAEQRLTLRRRVPDAERLIWARSVVASMEGRPPRNRPEVFAREQIYLHESPTAELKLQALRIGSLGVTAIPCEVYGITGLKIKAQSPFVPTINFSLANGEEGYIPPSEQHKLGGYSTWEARTAALEEQAEQKIVETVLALLEQVAGKPRRKLFETDGDYARTVRQSKPVAYWRMSEFSGPTALDCSGKEQHGVYEGGVVFFLEGPQAPGFSGTETVVGVPGKIARRESDQREDESRRTTFQPDQSSRLKENRAAHFAGGRMKAAINGLGQTYTVEMWIYNGMPGDARPVAGYFFSTGVDGADDAPGDHLGIGGTAAAADRLILYNGNSSGQLLQGRTRLQLKTWYHVVLVREGHRVTVYLDGDQEPEITGEAYVPDLSARQHLFVGGRNDNFANFAGMIDEVAVYDHALSPEEVSRHFQSARGK